MRIIHYLLWGLLAVIVVSGGVKAWRGYQASRQPIISTEEARERSSVPKPVIVEPAL